MNRPRLAPDQVAPSADAVVASFHRATVDEVADAVSKSGVVVVGMQQNPFVKKARALLKEAGVEFEYLEYGSYLGQWKTRLAIKLWAGFPTFPMVFIEKQLIGGFRELEALRDAGKLPGQVKSGSDAVS